MSTPFSEEQLFQRLRLDFDGTLGIVRRPTNQLRAFSAKNRWELTRRHPYYLHHWRAARPTPSIDFANDPDECMFHRLAMTYIGAIGVANETVDPQLEFHEFSGAGSQATAWLYGTAHPLTCRAIFSLLVAVLPAETLARIGQLLCESFGTGTVSDRPAALLQLANLEDPALKGYPDEPFLSVSPAASVRELQRDIPIALTPWRERSGVKQHRDRSDQVDKYLQIWDQREGWSGGRYVNSNERTLRQIAAERRLSISTVSNRYRSAFEMITGHPYSPATWLKVFGPIKFCDLLADTVGSVALRRPLVSPTRSAVPDRTISGADRSSIVESLSSTCDDQILADLRIDISDQLCSGKSFIQICRSLGIADDYENDLESLYLRLSELTPLKNT